MALAPSQQGKRKDVIRRCVAGYQVHVWTFKLTLDLASDCDKARFTKDKMAGWTGLEPAASGVTGRRYNQLNYHPTNGRRLTGA